MRKLLLCAAAVVFLTSCHTHRKQVEASAQQSEAQTSYSALCERLDTSAFAVTADIDSPEIVIVRNDSVTVTLRAKRAHLASQRKNAVVATSVSQAEENVKTEAVSNVESQNSTSTATASLLLVWLAATLVVIVIVKLVKKKLSCK